MDPPRNLTMETTARSRLFPALYSLPFVIAFGLSVAMLITDTNLQTDFGTASKYYLHWWAVLATAVADLVGVGLLLAFGNRTAVKLGVVGSGLIALGLVAVVFTWQQVGFTSMTQFAQYLFGVTYYGGDVRYLYDALLGTYVAAFVAGVVGLVATRPSRDVREAPTTPSGLSG